MVRKEPLKPIHLRWRFSLLLYCCLLFINASSSSVMASTQTINSLQVAYIYNISKFTLWPESTWPEKDTPFQLCFYGGNRVSKELLTLQNKEVSGHPINVFKPDQKLEFQQCNAFYIDTTKSHRYRYLLSLIDQQRVLVITHDSPFFSYGGLINLVEFEQRLRFQVSMQQLDDSQLKLSSKLLKLAILVESPR